MVGLCDLIVGFKNRMLEEMTSCLRLEGASGKSSVSLSYRVSMNMAHLNYLNHEFKQGNVLLRKYLSQDEYHGIGMFQRGVDLALKDYYGKDYHK